MFIPTRFIFYILDGATVIRKPTVGNRSEIGRDREREIMNPAGRSELVTETF